MCHVSNKYSRIVSSSAKIKIIRLRVCGGGYVVIRVEDVILYKTAQDVYISLSACCYLWAIGDFRAWRFNVGCEAPQQAAHQPHMQARQVGARRSFVVWVK